jgi:hypothetical protein
MRFSQDAVCADGVPRRTRGRDARCCLGTGLRHQPRLGPPECELVRACAARVTGVPRLHQVVPGLEASRRRDCRSYGQAEPGQCEEASQYRRANC